MQTYWQGLFKLEFGCEVKSYEQNLNKIQAPLDKIQRL